MFIGSIWCGKKLRSRRQVPKFLRNKIASNLKRRIERRDEKEVFEISNVKIEVDP